MRMNDFMKDMMKDMIICLATSNINVDALAQSQFLSNLHSVDVWAGQSLAVL